MLKHIQHWNCLAARLRPTDEGPQLQLPFDAQRQKSASHAVGSDSAARGFEAWCQRRDAAELQAAATAFVAITTARARAREVA
ncbi:MAG: hypothetical protein ACTHL8_01055 [Burkholderiaceae bacterium]